MRAAKSSLGLILLSFILVSTLYAQTVTPVEEYAARRARLLRQTGGPVVLFGYRSEDLTEWIIFQQEPNFFYLTGHTEPGAALLLVPLAARITGLPPEILFLPRSSRRAVVYDGLSVFAGVEGVEEKTGFVAVRPLEELKSVLEKVKRAFPALQTLLPARPGVEVDSMHAARMQAWLEKELPGVKLEDMRAEVNALRLIKSKTEIAAERWTNEVTREGHLAAMRSVRPGMVEHELAAAMEYEFRRRGCKPGYGSIAGSGPNSVILHYNEVNRKMKAGEVVVLDVAASCNGYTSDITRTLPVSGKFTKRQRQIYEIVLGAQVAAIKAVKPGMMLSGNGENSLNRIAREYIRQKGEEIGEDLTKYILHGLGHYVGLQVHDVGSYRQPLEAGMIITIEPGIYIAEENLGVRIEDVVLVTENGGMVISKNIPKTISALESIMSPSRWKATTAACIQRMSAPIYPPIARQARIKGEVRVEITVNSTGQTKNIKVLRGHPLLAQSAVIFFQEVTFGCLDLLGKFPSKFPFVVRYKLYDAWGVSLPPIRFGWPGYVEIIGSPFPSDHTGSNVN